MRPIALLLFLCCVAWQVPALAGAAEKRAQAEMLFGTPHVLRLSIEVSPAAIRSLRREPRRYMSATIREGDTIYTNVELHLRGSIGSFRPVDDKPGLTIKIEKGAQRFHGLKKFHLNNSVQDPTYLSEWLCTDLFRRAGVPAPRVSHAFVELNGRKLGFYLLKESFNEDF